MLPFQEPLRAEGHVCTIAHSFPEKYDFLPWLGFRPSQWLKRVVRYLHLCKAKWGRYDAVIIERELFDNPTWDMEVKLRGMTKALVLDIDDAVFLKYPEKFAEIIQLVDLVVVGNQLLEQWAAALHRRVVMIPTCIDTVAYQPRATLVKPPGSPLVIGWMGTAGNIVYLKELTAALRSLSQTHAFEFHVIATHRGRLDELELEGVRVVFRQWNPATEATDILDFDIGVMPLTDDPWSRYKCGLKLLQYMAIGIPGVASPVGANRDIITHGVDGFFASGTDDWKTVLSNLLLDAQLRQSIGKAARETVERRYSISANLPRWMSAVRETVEASSTM